MLHLFIMLWYCIAKKYVELRELAMNKYLQFLELSLIC